MNHQPDRQASASAPTSVAPNPSDAPPASGSISRSELQQALIQSMNNMIPMTMASQSHPNSMQPPQVQSNSMQGQGQGRGLSSTPMDLVQQLLGNMNNNGNGNMNVGGASAAAAFAQSMPQPLSHGSNNNNNISSSNLVRQLVASLQAQQAQHQSQQQAQVQAAISRAFGPSAGAQQQMQQPNNGQSLFSQMQLAQAQGLISGNANLLSSLGGVGGDMSGSRDFQNPLMQWNQFDLQQRAAMNDRAGQEAAMKKQKTENSPLLMSYGQSMNKFGNFGNENLFASVPGLANAQLSNSVGVASLGNPARAASFGKDNEVDLQQKLAGARGAVIVPCRARGMPVDHNFKTAYFIIPDGIEHGDELVCSYPACRQAGVKFRYCVDCKVPVAKRNFRNRHRHGVPGGSVSGEEGDEDDSSGEDDNKTETDPSDRPAGFTMDGNSGTCMPAGESNESATQKEHVIVIPDKHKKKKSGSVRVPCRARGMPMAHNFKTAHFVIPPNIQHGDELVCSFPACRSAGAKFRYCLHCKVPVAKRNFRNRHKHGTSGEKKKSSPGQEKKDADMDEKDDDDVEEHPDDDDASVVDTEEDLKEDEGDLKPSATQTAAPASSVIPNSTNENTVSITSTHDPAKVQQWVSLLDTKPDPSDKQAMAIWMMNLMNATEAMSARAPERSDSVPKSSDAESTGSSMKESAKPPSPASDSCAVKTEELPEKSADV